MGKKSKVEFEAKIGQQNMKNFFYKQYLKQLQFIESIDYTVVADKPIV